KAFLLLSSWPAFYIPVAAVSLWAALFLDRRTALMIGIALSFLTASLNGFSLTAVTVYLVSSMTAVGVFRDRKHASNMVSGGFVAGLASGVTLIAAKFVFVGRFDVLVDLGKLWESDIFAAILGGTIAGVLAY